LACCFVQALKVVLMLVVLFKRLRLFESWISRDGVTMPGRLCIPLVYFKTNTLEISNHMSKKQKGIHVNVVVLLVIFL
jgi:hypothetical protein